MANAFHGEATAMVSDQRYTLRLDFNAMCAFEDETGGNAMEVLASLEDGRAGARTMRSLIWAMLQAHHAGVPVTVAGDILSHDPEALRRVLLAAMPAPPPGGSGNGKGRPQRPV